MSEDTQTLGSQIAPNNSDHRNIFQKMFGTGNNQQSGSPPH